MAILPLISPGSKIGSLSRKAENKCGTGREGEAKGAKRETQWATDKETTKSIKVSARGHLGKALLWLRCLLHSLNLGRVVCAGLRALRGASEPNGREEGAEIGRSSESDTDPSLQKREGHVSSLLQTSGIINPAFSRLPAK